MYKSVKILFDIIESGDCDAFDSYGSEDAIQDSFSEWNNSKDKSEYFLTVEFVELLYSKAIEYSRGCTYFSEKDEYFLKVKMISSAIYYLDEWDLMYVPMRIEAPNEFQSCIIKYQRRLCFNIINIGNIELLKLFSGQLHDSFLRKEGDYYFSYKPGLTEQSILGVSIIKLDIECVKFVFKDIVSQFEFYNDEDINDGRIKPQHDLEFYINQKNEFYNGNSILHILVMKREYEKAIFLISKGANIKIENNDKVTPVDILEAFSYLNNFNK